MTTTKSKPSINLLAWPGTHAKLVTPAELRAIPTPPPLGPRHKPVPHIELRDTLNSVVREFGFTISDEQLMTARPDRSRLFGACVVKPKKGKARELKDYAREGQSFALAYRSGNDGQVAIKLGAGLGITVCSNLCIFAEFIALSRKHTTGLNLERELREAVVRYIAQLAKTVEVTDAAKQHELEANEARLAIFDVFERGLVAPRLFPHVVRNYFQPERSWTDCTPNTRWGLNNAFTRAAGPLPPEAKLKVIRNVAHILLPHELN